MKLVNDELLRIPEPVVEFDIKDIFKSDEFERIRSYFTSRTFLIKLLVNIVISIFIVFSLYCIFRLITQEEGEGENKGLLDYGGIFPVNYFQ